MHLALDRELDVGDGDAMRPPHGDGDIKHMHLRFGDASKTPDELLEMSIGDYEDADVCDPWWSVYCTAGAEACDG